MRYQAAIFDLDGVIVDTARFHYLAWRETAAELGLDFTLEQNELLKGVSRMASLEILLKLAGRTAGEEEKLRMAEEKNRRYTGLVQTLTPADALPGAVDALDCLRRMGVRTALGSASRNAGTVLERLALAGRFDAIVDGTMVSRPKPDPEVFLRGAELLGIPPERCVVFEDSAAGIEAALSGGMYAVGIGGADVLEWANVLVRRIDREEVYRLFR